MKNRLKANRTFSLQHKKRAKNLSLYPLFKHRQMSTLNALSLNNTRRSENQIVVFNRVPKVGSQTFMELLRRLALRNNFKFHRDSVQRVETIRLAPYQQEELAEMVSELPTPSGNEQIEYLMLLSLCENGELLSVTGVIKQVSTSTM